MHIGKANRIMIFGRPGSGKSHLAFDLHLKTKIPLFHLDKIFYTDHWVERDTREFLQLQKNIVNNKRWIIDGNSIKSLEMRYKRADLCLYFDLPRITCIYRAIKRQFTDKSFIDDRAPNCPEKISWSLIKYLWVFDKRVKKTLHELKKKYPSVEFRHIKSLNQANKLRIEINEL